MRNQRDLKNFGDLSKSIIRKQFASAALALTMMEAIDALASIIDGLMISRMLGAEEMAAYGLGQPYYCVAAIFSGLLTVGCQNQCTRYMSSGKMEEANRVFTLVCALALLLSGAMTLLGIAFCTPLCALLGARGESAGLLAYTRQYMIGLLVGTPFAVLIPILLPIVQLDGDPVRANMVALAVGIGDVVGNVFFAVVLKMGLLGIGLGTTFSYALGAAVALSHFAKKDRMFRFRLRREDWRRIPKLVFTGLPRVVNQLCRTLCYVLINAIVLAAGATAGMAAMSILTSVSYLIFAPAMGIGAAALMMGGGFAGEQDIAGLKSMLSIALRDALAVMLVIAALVFAAAPMISAAFLPGDATVQPIAVMALRLYALSVPFNSVNIILLNHLEAVGTKRMVYFFTASYELLYPVLCALAMAGLMGLPGVFLSTAVANLLLLLTYIALGMLRRGSGYAGSERLLFLPAGFGIPDSDSVSLTVTSMDEVLDLSRQIQRFCREHGVDTRRAYLSALCVEEMAGNTVQYGFADGRPHTVDIRAMKKGDDVLLRLRDDCARFDLKEQVAHWTLNPEHPEENVGIRLILGMAKDVSYTNTMQTNLLLITV